MVLVAGCPRCAAEVTNETGGAWACAVHGATAPLWRADPASYDDFVAHLTASRPLPTWVPWPLGPGWQVTDFGCVAKEGHEPRASFLTCSGPSTQDGVVEVTAISEEPGTGLGARCAQAAYSDPGPETLDRAPDLKVDVDGTSVALWAVSTSESDADFDRTVLAGEAQGRWIWVVLRPASAVLMLPELGGFHDISGLGPELVSLPFGQVPHAW